MALPFLLILAFTLGLVLRLADLSNPPFDFHPTRQFFGAIRARAIYQQIAPNIPSWQRDLSARFLAREAQLEPLILEHLAAFLYRWTGETPAVGRALSGIFWIAGGIFLYLLTRNLTASPIAALAALLFYLFLPYGVDASRSFQPDPLMMLFLLAFWWAFDRWAQQPHDWRWAILAGLTGGLDIYIKLTVVFFVIGGAIGLWLAR
ncbi:MAG: glycosyltransferase family 39 protein, partial [Anaerolineae bacterium]